MVDTISITSLVTTIIFADMDVGSEQESEREEEENFRNNDIERNNVHFLIIY